ncbi:MAG TPA: STAS domain-containing protein [Syntrophales bacterium]|nr:STAS domain-containing protein [Syntrophales bacterium]HOX93288.1 STAS domain-containing protein [Syntrophales bacterium]HPI56238.1 STAS domain-containing protein [Syntrophales bacterium]HPN24425.1 STAS domain-containing protein [Syntrophales bacterium]HQM29055.1 STAS domain-containing protein [Syntrophales bacterium]
MGTKSRVRTKGAPSVLQPNGDLVASTIEDFRKQVRSVLRKSPVSLVLDLSHVRMVDSVGLGVLIAAHNAFRKKGVKLAVANVSREIYDLFAAMQLDRHFEIGKAP